MLQDLTIAWVSRNRPELLRRSLLSIPPEIPASRLIVTDQCDTDYRRGYRELLDYRTYIVERRRKAGLAQNWNQCILHADTRYLLICNDDMIFRPSLWGTIERDVLEENKEWAYYYNCGAFLIDTAIIPKMGWFDERFTQGTCEDIDTVIRLNAHAIRCIYHPAGLHVDHVFDFEPETRKATACQWWHPQANVQHFIAKYGRQPGQVRLSNGVVLDALPSPQLPDPDWYPAATAELRRKYCS